MFGNRTKDRRNVQLIDELLEKKNYIDLKKPAEEFGEQLEEKTVINLLHEQIISYEQL